MIVRLKAFIIFIFIICFPTMVIPLAINQSNKSINDIGKTYLKKRQQVSGKVRQGSVIH